MEKTNAAALLRKGALWLISFAFVLLLSSSIIGYAFTQKFFDPQTYYKSMERHGVYDKLHEFFLSSFTNQFPGEIRSEAKAMVAQAITPIYVRGEVDRMVGSGLDYLSSRQEGLDLAMDLSPLREAAEKSQDPLFQSVAPAMPQSMDFGKAIQGSPQFSQLQQLRAQIAEADRFNSIALIASILALIPYFLLQPDYGTGLHECGKLILGCATSTLLGGLAIAFLTPQFLPQFLSGAQPDLQSAGSAVLIGQIIGDAIYEVGIAAALYSLPLAALGLALRLAFHPSSLHALPDMGKPAPGSR